LMGCVRKTRNGGGSWGGKKKIGPRGKASPHVFALRQCIAEATEERKRQRDVKEKALGQNSLSPDNGSQKKLRRPVPSEERARKKKEKWGKAR